MPKSTLVTSATAQGIVSRVFTPGRRLAVDTETTGLTWHRDHVVGLSVYDGCEAYYFPFRHTNGANLDLSILRDICKRLHKVNLLGFNWGAFDARMLRRDGYDLELQEFWDDAKLLAYAENENPPRKLELYALKYGIADDPERHEKELLERIARVMTEAYRAVGSRKTEKPRSALKAEMHRLPAEYCAAYACNDVILTWDLWEHVEPLVRAVKLFEIYRSFVDTEMVLHDANVAGMLVDKKALAEVTEHAEEQKAALELKIKEQLRLEIPDANIDDFIDLNIGSPKQLCSIFRVDSSASDTIRELVAGGRESAKTLLTWRKYSKALSTYYRPIANLLDEHNYLHPNINQAGAVVRMSGNTPNMQAIPRMDDDRIYRVKEIFPALEGYKMINADLSQAEIIMNYHYSNDQGYYDIISTGASMHDLVAQELGIDRQDAKPVNFAGQYGVGAAKLALILSSFWGRKVETPEASAMLAGRYKAFPRDRRCYQYMQNIAKRDGFLELWSGRRRRYDPGVSPHTAWNNIVQGGVSEMIRVALIEARKRGLSTRLTVHDNLVIVAKDEDVQDTMSEVSKFMTDFPWLRYPIKCDTSAAQVWSKCK